MPSVKRSDLSRRTRNATRVYKRRRQQRSESNIMRIPQARKTMKSKEPIESTSRARQQNIPQQHSETNIMRIPQARKPMKSKEPIASTSRARQQNIPFRYTCVQCEDWDMCAACEACGEHPAHYLPKSKPYEGSEPVLTSTRKHIGEVVVLKNEMHDVVIKQEMIKVKEEPGLDITENDPIEFNISIVPEMNMEQNNSGSFLSVSCAPVSTDGASSQARADAAMSDVKQEPRDRDYLVIDEASAESAEVS